MILKKILKNAQLLQFVENNYIINNADICIDNNMVVDVGNLDIESDMVVIDLTGKLILPSLFNIHCHLGENMFANISGNEWTIESYLKYTENYHQQYSRNEVEEMWKKSAKDTIFENFKNGVFGFCAARSAEPSRQYNMDTMSGYPVMHSKKLQHFLESGIIGFENYYNTWNTNECSVGVFLHSLYANNEDALFLAKKMMEFGEFISVHIAEDEITKEKEIGAFGKSPVQVLKDYNLLDKKTILVHGGCLSKEELEEISTSGATIVICPIANSFLNTTPPDIYQLKKLGIPWCIATDGLGTGRTFSLFQQAVFLKHMFPKLTYQELLQSMTITPGKLYARSHYTGKIEKGTAVHWIVMDAIDKNVENVLKLLFTGASQFNVFTGEF
jgi:cytosine/adenosine deaminase-related metal-dependent hydrolase